MVASTAVPDRNVDVVWPRSLLVAFGCRGRSRRCLPDRLRRGAAALPGRRFELLDSIPANYPRKIWDLYDDAGPDCPTLQCMSCTVRDYSPCILQVRPLRDRIVWISLYD